MSAVHDATTFLFVPGDRPDRYDKARAAGADVVVIDLEDAVAVERKTVARDALLEAAPRLGDRVMVRMSTPGTPAGEADLEVLARVRPTAVIVAKAEPDALALVHRRLPEAELVPLIETARAVDHVRMIAGAPGVARLAVGHLDLAEDLGVAPTSAVIDHARCEVVISSRSGSLSAPIDGVTVDLDDAGVAHADARAARELGFGAKLCLHPRQLPPVARAFAPSADEVAWAQAIIGAVDDAGDGAGAGAIRIGTEMIDPPVLKRARLLLAKAGPRD